MPTQGAQRPRHATNNVQRSLGVQRSRPRVLCRRNLLFHWRAATHQVPLAAAAPLPGLTAAQQEGQMRWAQIAPACGHNATIVGLNSKQLRNYRELRRSRATPSNQLLLVAQRRSGIGNAWKRNSICALFCNNCHLLLSQLFLYLSKGRPRLYLHACMVTCCETQAKKPTVAGPS